ncbi:MAG TPA: transglutaminase family protein [Flavisolibacter sp.]|nr:transglutaminase family protein [Flavisolibacter sp.]
MPVFKIQHITKYEYDWQVKESVNEIKVFPYQGDNQEVLQHELLITGNPYVNTYLDYWHNKTGVFNLLSPHKELVIESRLVIRATASPDLKVNFESGFDKLEEEVSSNLQLIELATADNIESQTAIEEIIKTIFSKDYSVAKIAGDCCTYIYDNFNYIKGITNIETTVDEVLDRKAGVCQDFAHVMLQILRSVNIPSRYVSGYICPNKNGMRGEGATHAWVEAWIPEQGWAGIDPTNNVWVTNKHIKLAVGRNFTDCTPVKGTFKGSANQKLSVYVSIGYEDGHLFHDINDVKTNTSHKYGTQSENAMQQ